MFGYLQDTVLSPLAVSVSLVLLARLALLVSSFVHFILISHLDLFVVSVPWTQHPAGDPRKCRPSDRVAFAELSGRLIAWGGCARM